MRVVVGGWWVVASDWQRQRVVHQPPTSNHQPLFPKSHRAFTLVELLITISIIGILASMVLFAMTQAQEAARASKTRALIAALDAIIQEKYEAFLTRRAPLNLQDDVLTNDVNGNKQYDPGDGDTYIDVDGDGVFRVYPAAQRAKMRLDVLRDLMRMELPDRLSDVFNGPHTPFFMPMIQDSAKRQTMHASLPGPPSTEYEGAECLYQIVMACLAEEGDSRDLFKPDQVGDVDDDGAPEFLDGWGHPIGFLRWAPGYLSEAQQIARVPRSQYVAAPSGNTVTITITAPAARQFSTDATLYLRGALGVLTNNSNEPERLLGNRIGRITNYVHDGTSVTITCSTPASAPSPFPGGAPSGSENIVVMPPDPFDARGVYPFYDSLSYYGQVYRQWELPTFALKPLIYSAGPNRCYGIVTGFSGLSPLNYHEVAAGHPGLNPCFSFNDGMIGERGDLPGEPFYVRSGWLDNITNHDLGTR